MKIDFSEVICEILKGIKMASNSECIVAAISFSWQISGRSAVLFCPHQMVSR